MGEKPSGTVTFLFTDIEGSTQLWEDHHEEMKGALGVHDDLMRAVIEGAGGYVFTTAGDAFSAAFPDPKAAAEAAVGCQVRLAEESWPVPGGIRVRMAVHTGVAHERGGDYFGPALNRTARILSTGHGGQVLVSLATEELLQGRVDGLDFRDLGEHTLKDLGRPERIFQLTHPDLRDDFPDIRSLESRPNNLPIQLTSFVGRELELNEVVKRLADSRLLTLTGVGGSGKTRLALQAAAESIEDYPHGAFLVELAATSDPDLVDYTIAEALGVVGGSSGGGNIAIGGDSKSVMEQLVEYLEKRKVLLVLDNCEHLITATARVVEELLRRCGDLSVMATSREGLGVMGENLWQVPSLGRSAGAEDELGDAVLLFAERASAVQARFELDDASLPAVRQICDRLDGMPLAIELAAARVKVLKPAQIAERLDDRFRLLTGGSRTALPRHQTLQATVDWSYELLSDNEKTLFGRLAAFRGGFDLEAAEATTAGGELDRYDVLDLLAQLVDKSIVANDEVSGRFGMLETLRQYALGKLTESNEVEEVRLMHARYFADLAAEASESEHGPDEAGWYDRLDKDSDNLRAAIQFSFENGHEQLAVEMVSNLAWYWWSRSKIKEGNDWMAQARPHLGLVSTESASWLLTMYSITQSATGDHELQMQLAQEVQALAAEAGNELSSVHASFAVAWAHHDALDMDAYRAEAEVMRQKAEALGEAWLTAFANFLLAWDLRMRAEPEEAERILDVTIEQFRAIGDKGTLAFCIGTAGILARYRFDFEKEIALQAEAREIAREIGNRGLEVFTLVCAGISLRHLGRFEEALESMERGIELDRASGQVDITSESLGLLAEARYYAGDPPGSLDALREAFEASAEFQNPMELAQTLEFMLPLLLDGARFEEAGRAIGFVETRRKAASRPVPPPSRQEYAAQVRRTREALGSSYDAAYVAGAGLSEQEAFDLGVWLVRELSSTLG